MTDRFQNTAQPDTDWWEALWPEPGDTLRTLGLERDDTALDLCCGDGHFTVAMARIVASRRVVAVDIDERLLDAVSERADGAGLGNVETVRCDARELPAHVDGPFDFALLANTLHGADEPAALLDRVREVLGDEARLAVINWRDAPSERTTVLDEPRGPPEALRMTPDETAAAGRAAGYAVVERVELPPHHHAVVLGQDRD